MSTETQTFYSGPGYKLMSVLTLPPDCDTSRSVSCVVLCHGPGGYGIPGLTEQDPLMIRVGDFLAGVGYASLRFYYRGVGESEGPLYRMIPMEQVEDVRAAISFLQSRQEIDPNRIGLLGVATGGSHATYVSAIDERVKCMVSISGIGDWRRWLRSMRSEEEWQLFVDRARLASVAKAATGTTETVQMPEVIKSDPESQKEKARAINGVPAMDRDLVAVESVLPMLAYRPEEYASKISPRAAMWIGAAEDLVVPIRESESMCRNAQEPKRLEIIEGVTHCGLYFDEGFAKVMQLAREWFDMYLK